MFLSSFNDSPKKMKRGEVKRNLVAPKKPSLFVCIFVYIYLYICFFVFFFFVFFLQIKGLEVFLQFSGSFLVLRMTK